MKFIAIIPARYQSTRFPGKLLAKIKDKSIIQEVFENTAKVVAETWIATDDELIAEEVKRFGGQYVMTSRDHMNGTDRCAEAAEILSNKIDFDVIINIQGDEPFVKSEQIEALKGCFEDEQTQIATLVKTIEDYDTLFNPNRPKVVFDKQMNVLLFSRSPIPFIRGVSKDKWLDKNVFYSHLGMYAYKSPVLKDIARLIQTPLEISESLEQLRWLENGYKIKASISKYGSFGIDTPEDLENARNFF